MAVMVMVAAAHSADGGLIIHERHLDRMFSMSGAESADKYVFGAASDKKTYRCAVIRLRIHRTFTSTRSPCLM